MALDRWLLTQHYRGLHPATLRFYTWSPPAISLGYHQSKYPADWQQIAWKGEPVELIRRPTGGRAVLHQGDLTYAIVTSGLVGSRVHVYKQVCEFLIQGWRSLGVDLYYGSAGRGYIHNPNCFGTATDADLVLANGAKLIGSAQLKRGNAILQHGSIRLQPDAALFTQVFGSESFQSVDLSLSLAEVDLVQTVTQALIVAAEQYFDMQLLVQPLSASEWEQVLARQE